MPKATSSVHALGVTPLSMTRARRAGVRWRCLVYLDAERPDRTTDAALLAIIQDVYPDASLHELRREIDYLADQKLLTVAEKRSRWHLKLTWQGVDVVEYTSACPDGIGRPVVPQ